MLPDTISRNLVSGHKSNKDEHDNRNSQRFVNATPIMKRKESVTNVMLNERDDRGSANPNSAYKKTNVVNHCFHGVDTENSASLKRYTVEKPLFKDEIHSQYNRQSQHGRYHSEVVPDDTSLFIGDLSRHASEDTLRELFSKYGSVIDVEVKRDKFTRNNLGYGFVTFKTHREAEVALKKMQGRELFGRTIRVGWAQKNTNLFIGGLDRTMDTEYLRRIFERYGPICNDGTFIKNNGLGFVKFKNRIHAETAKAELDGKYLLIPGTNQFMKNPIRIGWGDTNTQKNCVHVQFDSTNAAQVDIKETEFRQIFQRFGRVTKISIPRFPDRKSKGYAFVHFEENDNGEAAAAQAITTLSYTRLSNITIRCGFGRRQNQRQKLFNKSFSSEELDDVLSLQYLMNAISLSTDRNTQGPSNVVQSFDTSRLASKSYNVRDQMDQFVNNSVLTSNQSHTLPLDRYSGIYEKNWENKGVSPPCMSFGPPLSPPPALCSSSNLFNMSDSPNIQLSPSVSNYQFSTHPTSSKTKWLEPHISLPPNVGSIKNSFPLLSRANPDFTNDVSFNRNNSTQYFSPNYK